MTNKITNAENLSKKIGQDIKTATNNANKLNDIRIRKMAEKLQRFQEILNNILKTHKYEEIKNYVVDVFQKIIWEERNLSQETIDTNYDYKIFINYIYAIVSYNNISYDINLSREQYYRIYKDILEKIDTLANGGDI